MVQSHRLGDCLALNYGKKSLERQISKHVNCIRQSYTYYFCWLEVGFSHLNGMSGQYDVFQGSLYLLYGSWRWENSEGRHHNKGKTNYRLKWATGYSMYKKLSYGLQLYTF